MQKEKNCPCIKADCERHGDCVACHTHHIPKQNPPFCKRPGTQAPEGLAERVTAKLRAAGMPPGAGAAWGANAP